MGLGSCGGGKEGDGWDGVELVGIYWGEIIFSRRSEMGNRDISFLKYFEKTRVSSENIHLSFFSPRVYGPFDDFSGSIIQKPRLPVPCNRTIYSY